MLINNNFNLSYCTNIHPGETWDETFISLKENLLAVKKKVSPYKKFGIGLRLSQLAAKGLSAGENLTNFKNWLDENDLYVFTMNGFPYGSFHHKKVKDKVHHPDWTTEDRLNYTLQLFRILEVLTPGNGEGSISTSPLSYKPWYFHQPNKVNDVLKLSTIHLIKVAIHLYRTYRKTGKILHLDIEPEPDGLIENMDDVISYFNKYLIPVGSQLISKEFKVDMDEAREIVLNHIRLCYDVCHFALTYAEPKNVLDKLSETGIKVGKVQISAAIKVKFDQDYDHRKLIFKELSEFAESTYLHQVIEQDRNLQTKQYPDLPQALRNIHANDLNEWRIHFHVPVFLEQYKHLSSTQDDVVEVLRLLRDRGFSNHLEVETYTWEVLPFNLKTHLVDSICRELNWVVEELKEENVNSIIK
jgi:hypothetical protein